VLQSLLLYAQLIAPRVAPRHRGGRIKQWLNMLRRHYPQAQTVYESVRAQADGGVLESSLRALLEAQEPVVALQDEPARAECTAAAHWARWPQALGPGAA
jgi:tRNA-dihydrouridine synthase C